MRKLILAGDSLYAYKTDKTDKGSTSCSLYYSKHGEWSTHFKGKLAGTINDSGDGVAVRLLRLFGTDEDEEIFLDYCELELVEALIKIYRRSQ